MTVKSKTCFSKNGVALSEYESEEEAQKSADYLLNSKNKNLYPYLCNKCKKWHLAPVESKVNFLEDGCFCEDSNGGTKRLYLSKEDAEKQKINSEKEKGIKLYIYKCPEGKGWHLSHKNFDY